MKIYNFVPLLCIGGAYALPALPWLAQIPVEGLVRCWGMFAPLSEDRTIYQVLKDDERSLMIQSGLTHFNSLAGTRV